MMGDEGTYEDASSMEAALRILKVHEMLEESERALKHAHLVFRMEDGQLASGLARVKEARELIAGFIRRHPVYGRG